MNEKDITFYLPLSAYQLLERDRTTFQCGNHISTMIKTILINHYQAYNDSLLYFYHTFYKAMKRHDCSFTQASTQQYDAFAWDIYKNMYYNTLNQHLSIHMNEEKKKIHLRQNKHETVLDLILDSIPFCASQTEYLANIIYSYLDKPSYKREQILYASILEKIQTAINEKHSIKIVTNTSHQRNHVPNKTHIIQPKEIVHSNEEIYNYLFYQEYHQKQAQWYANTIHLCNILEVAYDAQPYQFTKEVEQFFNRMKCNGIQYSIHNDQTIKIQFTPKGLILFQLKYLERPLPLEPLSSTRDVYHFNCSIMQFYNYFSSFYDEITILEPASLIEDVKALHQSIFQRYKTDE